MKIKNNFQSQENPHKFGFSVPENLKKVKKVFSAFKLSQNVGGGKRV